MRISRKRSRTRSSEVIGGAAHCPPDLRPDAPREHQDGGAHESVASIARFRRDNDNSPRASEHGGRLYTRSMLSPRSPFRDPYRPARTEALARFLERCRAHHGMLKLSCLKAQARPRIAESIRAQNKAPAGAFAAKTGKPPGNPSFLLASSPGKRAPFSWAGLPTHNRRREGHSSFLDFREQG
jgi:hypothetical protein